MTDGLHPAFRHPTALVESDTIGEGARIFAYTHVLEGAVIGTDVTLSDHVLVEGGAVLGDRVTIKSGVQVWTGVRLGDDVFVGPNATFTNDLFPRSRNVEFTVSETVVEDGASIGGGAVIVAGTRIGAGALVGAGAVVTKDVPPRAVVVGNPAKVLRYLE